MCDGMRGDTDMFCCKITLVSGNAERQTLKVNDFVFLKIGGKFAPILPLSNYPVNLEVNVKNTYVLKSLLKR